MQRDTLSLAGEKYSRLLLCAAALLAAAQGMHAQGILGPNLIVNGDAETGLPGTPTTPPASIPGWTLTGKPTVLPYTIASYLVLTDPAPQNHGFQYFAADPNGAASTLAQNIDVSSAASTINGGNVKYTASAYLGSASGSGLAPPAQMAVAFKNANGQTFNTATVGPLGFNGNGMSLQQEIGLVPSGTVTVTVTLTISTHCFNAAQCASGAADSLSLMFSPLGTAPASVLGTNLITNSGAEAGPGSRTSTALYVPGWSTAGGASVAPYGGTGWIGVSDPGPADRAVNLFCGPGSSYEDVDVSAASTLIDAGQVTYYVSGWLGKLAGTNGPTLTYQFFDWSGTQLAVTAQLGPPSQSGTGLFETSNSGPLPAGTRRVRILLTFPGGDSLADDINFTLAAPSGPPVIKPAGIVSATAYGAFSSIAPGTWIEIYGTNLAPDTRGWAGSDFNNGVGPTSLDGVTVSVGGAPAYLDYISPGQINALVPSNAPLGVQEVTVTNSTAGTSDGFGIQVNATQPGLLALQVGTRQYVGAVFSDGQTFAIPQNAIAGLPSRAAQSGDVLTIYGVGFGPVTPGFSAGTIVTQQNTLTAPLQVLFNTTAVTPTYYGLAPSYTGLYQFNVVVPIVAANAALPISFTLGGVKGTQTLYIAVQ
jgi:uncharacterized protein (TIGR03437 family)